jgi:hypothetical protein
MAEGYYLEANFSYEDKNEDGKNITISGNWIQPIAVYINPYFSRIINEWDGSF